MLGTLRSGVVGIGKIIGAGRGAFPRYPKGLALDLAGLNRMFFNAWSRVSHFSRQLDLRVREEAWFRASVPLGRVKPPLAQEYDVKGDVPNVINTTTQFVFLGLKALVATHAFPASCIGSHRSECIRVGDSVRTICVVDACAAGLASDQKDRRSVP